MHFKKLAVLFLVCLAISAENKAGATTCGPLSFGSNMPFSNECGFSGPYTDSLGNSYYIDQFLGPETYGNAPLSSLQTTAFTFDIEPNWSIDSIQLSSTFDYGVTQNTPYDDWSVFWEQEIILCSASDVCTTDIRTESLGGAPVPTFSLDTTAGPGTGVYESFLYLDNAQMITDNPDELTISLSETPEPSTLVLFATGALGFIPILVLRCRRHKRWIGA